MQALRKRKQIHVDSSRVTITHVVRVSLLFDPNLFVGKVGIAVVGGVGNPADHIEDLLVQQVRKLGNVLCHTVAAGLAEGSLLEKMP